jgi:hypothetical protein
MMQLCVLRRGAFLSGHSTTAPPPHPPGHRRHTADAHHREFDLAALVPVQQAEERVHPPVLQPPAKRRRTGREEEGEIASTLPASPLLMRTRRARRAQPALARGQTRRGAGRLRRQHVGRAWQCWHVLRCRPTTPVVFVHCADSDLKQVQSATHPAPSAPSQAGALPRGPRPLPLLLAQLPVTAAPAVPSRRRPALPASPRISRPTTGPGQ